MSIKISNNKQNHYLAAVRLRQFYFSLELMLAGCGQSVIWSS